MEGEGALSSTSSLKMKEYRMNARNVEAEIKAMDTQLRKVIRRIERESDSQGSKSDQPFETSGRRFQEEILVGFEAGISICRVLFEEMTYLRELFLDDLAREGAEIARKQASSGNTAIAFVPMLYLLV
ncbi:hypothetical protein B0T17DRAFT_349445 [Bombardia bombarda]|uniref:Uncharacterized protein n=1 Tax=Bombardia bombarda TaxID=252184 RepID=A0AA39WHR7_9PEZI|nr:hypothetical protein B0T17DRAFT_349445 [Bombardia bombarda]